MDIWVLRRKGNTFAYFVCQQLFSKSLRFKDFVSAHIIPGVILVSMCFISQHAAFSAGLDIFNTALMGSINLTVNQNSQDLSPNFASTGKRESSLNCLFRKTFICFAVFGIVNFTGNLGGFFMLYSLAALNNLNVRKT